MKITKLLPLLTLHGRTVTDREKEALFINWSCTGFTVRFTGSHLRAKLTSLGDEIPSPPGFPPTPTYYPWLAVTEDGETITNRQEVREEGWYTLWEGTTGEHTLRVVRLTENSRGKLGVLELEADGEFFSAPPITKPRLELIGDSITCGFGNEAPNNAFEFKTEEENGWMTYGAIAARKLGYEFNMICESGISACKPEKPLFPMHAMNEIYHLTDEPYDCRRGVEPAPWDFAANPSHIVVLNLGTNDCNPMRFYQNYEDVEGMEDWFHRRYREFIRHIRELNGPDTFIVCTLGSMDYFLYNHIEAAVKEYQAETGDEKIHCFKYVGINMMTEGFGAAGHPSMKTHLRMAEELVTQLKKYVIKE